MTAKWMCTATLQNGQPCPYSTLIDEPVCFFHWQAKVLSLHLGADWITPFDAKGNPKPRGRYEAGDK